MYQCNMSVWFQRFFQKKPIRRQLALMTPLDFLQKQNFRSMKGALLPSLNLFDGGFGED